MMAEGSVSKPAAAVRFPSRSTGVAPSSCDSDPPSGRPAGSFNSSTSVSPPDLATETAIDPVPQPRIQKRLEIAKDLITQQRILAAREGTTRQYIDDIQLTGQPFGLSLPASQFP